MEKPVIRTVPHLPEEKVLEAMLLEEYQQRKKQYGR